MLEQFPDEGLEQRRALKDAYPFGERRYAPYKIWLDEIARQKGKKPPVGRRLPSVLCVLEGQLSLSDG